MGVPFSHAGRNPVPESLVRLGVDSLAVEALLLQSAVLIVQDIAGEALADGGAAYRGHR